jgi:hypothetical protein
MSHAAPLAYSVAAAIGEPRQRVQAIQPCGGAHR